MKYLFILLGIAVFIVAVVLITAYICFYMAFFVPKRKEEKSDEFSLPPGDIYLPYSGIMINWMKEVRKLPFKEVSVKSFDGLTLVGKYYEYKDGAPIELMLHGYRGSAERDLCGGIQRCFALGRNVLLVDLRASGKSEGNVITFGINESKDCLVWIDYIIKTFGKDVKIILTGISMGAATVIMTAGRELPSNVVGVLADCGYSTARDIIKKTIKEMKLPVNILYPFVKLGAKIFGKFNLEETSPLEAVKKCKIPVIFFHGEDDDFVPCQMSETVFNACNSPKKLITVSGAGHGMSYLVEPERYLKELADFFTQNGLETKIQK